ncbi:protogenin-like [Pectinophora gossypiella]|uniref:protogenin-like n=1 Tax=Pectinophora gossypiella TaxID=13191 RepID=UPI00214F1E07|nr:protogenin-like [Pectinophora gossypiella]
MALMLLRVLLLGVVAAAADDVPITWWSGGRASLPCVAPLAERLQPRRPPPPLAAEDTPPAKPYLWKRGDEEISSKRVSASGALEVSRRREEGSRRRDGEGVYQCQVRHHGGIVLGYPTHLKFASMEKQFSVHPANTTAASGQPVVLSCAIISAPPAVVSWLKDDQPLPDDERYYVLQSQLLITDVTSEDAGAYRCVATNIQMNKSRTSHTGTLEVSTSGDEDLEVSLLPVTQETNILAARGSRVVLPCPVVGWPRPRLVWQLTPPGQRESELDVTQEVFVIHSLQSDQEGNYTCSVEGSPHLAKMFTVTLTEPAEIMIPPSSKEALRASTVRFNCTAVGRPAPTVTWYKDGQPLQMAGRNNLRKSTDGQRTELVISGVTSDDAGVYQCFAHNAISVASSWAMLNVTGVDAAAPTNVQCWPVGDRKVKVTWQRPVVGEVVAYTVHGTPEEDKADSLPGHPLTKTEEIVTVDKPLIPYRFQVRAYSRLTAFIKNVASDLSKGAICQGQGVPIRLAKLEEGGVVVSWKQFAEDNPGVMQWILQYKNEGGTEHNVTLDGSVYNYTLDVSPSSPMLVRVLGSRTATWLRQDLTMVPWASTAAAAADLDAGDVIAIPQDIEPTHIGPREFTVTWRCDEADERYTYVACARSEGADQCQDSDMKTATFKGLEPGTDYEVRVQAREAHRALGGAFSAPYVLMTTNETPQRFKEFSGHFVNSSTLRVSWNGAPAKYTVHYSAQLKLPVEKWASLETSSNTVLIPGIDPTETTYLMVFGYNPEEHSRIETIPPLYKDLEAKDLRYEYTSSGVRVWWQGVGPRVVSYAQNITRPLEQWRTVNVTADSIEIEGLDPSLPTYVMVTSNRRSPARSSQVLNIAPRPPSDSNIYLVIGIVLGVCVLCALALAAVCLWRKRKRARSPVRSRRRNTATAEGNTEEESEMKSVGGARGGRLANGGAGAGEPLLNGHVHITENPTSKTPNGKMKKRRHDAAFDVSRYDPDATLETVLDADTSTTSYHLLDTSRKPELDLSRSQNLTTNNSFAKVPDDNMNSELNRSSFTDNSKIQPTLQPNG